MKLITIHPALKAGIIFGILLLLFLLYRGCQSSKHRAAENIALKAALDSLTLKKKMDSMSAAQHQKDYEDSLRFINGQIALKDNKLAATEIQLLATTQDAYAWKRKYESVKPDMDTSVTMVPNAFIEDCHECFDQAEKVADLVRSNISKNKELDSLHKVKEQLQDNRIKQLGQEREAVRLTLNDCLAAAKRQSKLLEPRRIVYLTMGIIGKESSLLMGVGAGLVYQDKRKRGFGLNAYGTNQGTIVTGNLMLPLSFRRK